MHTNQKIIFIGLITLLISGVFVLSPKNVRSQDKQFIYFTSLFPQLTKNQLMGLTDLVVLGQVTQTKRFEAPPVLFEKTNSVYTRIIIAVDSTLYDPKNISPKEVSFVIKGGETKNIALISEDIETFKTGGTYVLFLKREPYKKDFSLAIGNGVVELTTGTVGVGEKTQAWVRDTFDLPLTLEQLKKELHTTKPEPLPGLAED